MARISFTQPERGGLLARAVLHELADPADGRTVDDLELTKLVDLARALEEGNGRAFDDLLVAEFHDVALAALGAADGPADGEVELEPETAAG